MSMGPEEGGGGTRSARGDEGIGGYPIPSKCII